ncbi:hypothetical protein ABLN67_11300, partial [Mycobacterium tuberculosis]
HFVQLSFGCLTVSSIGGNGVFAFIVKRFRVFRAPLQRCHHRWVGHARPSPRIAQPIVCVQGAA